MSEKEFNKEKECSLYLIDIAYEIETFMCNAPKDTHIYSEIEKIRETVFNLLPCRQEFEKSFKQTKEKYSYLFERNEQ